MKRYERLDEATGPDGTVLTLYRHDGAYVIRIGAIELMSTRRHYSEDRLAEVVCAPLAAKPGAHVLVGGLGLGFTLRTALAALGPDARVTVAELVEAVIRWNRNPEWNLAADTLADPRTVVVNDDVARVLAASPGAFDGIMLDVDNGADALIQASNAKLYRDAGIRAAIAALRPGGRLAYWSATPDPNFATALRRNGLDVEVETLHAWQGAGGTPHAIYLARRAGEKRADAKRG